MLDMIPDGGIRPHFRRALGDVAAEMRYNQWLGTGQGRGNLLTPNQRQAWSRGAGSARARESGEAVGPPGSALSQLRQGLVAAGLALGLAACFLSLLYAGQDPGRTAVCRSVVGPAGAEALAG